MNTIDLVVDNLTEKEKELFPDLYKFGAEDSNFIGTDNDPFVYEGNLPGTKTRIDSVAKRVEIVDTIAREAKTSVEMLTNFLNYFTLLKSLPGCNYIAGREMSSYSGCKGYTSGKIDNLYKVTTDIIGFCKLRDPTLFTNAETMMLLNNILYTLITFTGVYLFNTPSKSITTMVNKINTFLGKERIFYQCKKGYDDYTCGRAVGYIPCSENEPGYILIFNTISKDNDEQDLDYYLKKLEIINETRCPKKEVNKNKNTNTNTTKSTNITGAGAGAATSGGKRKIKRTRRIPKKQKRKSRKY